MELKILYQRIASISNNVQRLSNALYTMSVIKLPDAFEEYEKLSIETAQEAEWIALRMRHLIYLNPYNKAWDYLPRAVEGLGIEITENNGIYEIMLPGLMPKKRSRLGSEFVVDPLMFALRQYAMGHRITRFHHSTVCFVLVYDQNLPTRRIRDYDNVELKPILDAAATYLMDSDGGLDCDTYYSTELGEADCTRMYIMDTKRYPEWYAKHQEALHSTENQT